MATTTSLASSSQQQQISTTRFGGEISCTATNTKGRCGCTRVEEGYRLIRAADAAPLQSATKKPRKLLNTSRPVDRAGFARCMLTSMDDYEKTMHKYKRQLFGTHVVGNRVVEVGIGAGVNLPHYMTAHTPNRVVKGVEPNPHMRALAIDKARSLGLDDAERRIAVVDGRAEELPFASGSIDSVVSTLLLCSVRDVDASLAEIARVLRPGGRYVFVEHVMASGLGLRMMQRFFDPMQRFLMGCTLTGDVAARLEAAHGREDEGIEDNFGFRSMRMERFQLPNVPREPFLQCPAVAGASPCHAAGSDTTTSTAGVGLKSHYLLAPHLVGVLVKQ